MKFKKKKESLASPPGLKKKKVSRDGRPDYVKSRILFSVLKNGSSIAELTALTEKRQFSRNTLSYNLSL